MRTTMSARILYPIVQPMGSLPQVGVLLKIGLGGISSLYKMSIISLKVIES